MYATIVRVPWTDVCEFVAWAATGREVCTSQIHILKTHGAANGVKAVDSNPVGITTTVHVLAS